MYKCRICEQVFEEIPNNAIQVGGRMGVRRLFRFADGSIHDLYSTKVGKKKLAAEPPKEQ